jgi:hypothetical protein
MRAILLAIPLVFTSASAFAVQSNGNAALALAAQIGAEDPVLSASQKSVLAHFLNGQTQVSIPPEARRITVKADRIRCRMGDVDVGLHDCALTFGTRSVTKTGGAGQMLLATMQENGVEADGAAGTIFYTVAPISCTVDAGQVESHDGGGAKCTFTNGE